ncbi:reverse transcriptase-like protein [bacterium]|nr:reverse transcriptase-like protein [bacterium]
MNRHTFKYIHKMMNATNTCIKETESGYSILKGNPNVKESECYLLQFDGLAEPNPGQASGGAILYSHSKDPLYETGEYIKFATNNVAEYTGLIIGLRLALEKGYTKLLVEGDSQLIIFQTQGKWKVKNENLQKYNTQARSLVSQFEFIALRHIRRDLNKEADRITKEVVKSKENFVLEYEYLVPV